MDLWPEEMAFSLQVQWVSLAPKKYLNLSFSICKLKLSFTGPGKEFMSSY